MVAGMNTRQLAESLSQHLDTSCTEFPDGFEDTQQLQVNNYIEIWECICAIFLRQIIYWQVDFMFLFLFSLNWIETQVNFIKVYNESAIVIAKKCLFLKLLEIMKEMKWISLFVCNDSSEPPRTLQLISLWIISILWNIAYLKYAISDKSKTYLVLFLHRPGWN